MRTSATFWQAGIKISIAIRVQASLPAPTEVHQALVSVAMSAAFCHPPGWQRCYGCFLVTSVSPLPRSSRIVAKADNSDEKPAQASRGRGFGESQDMSSGKAKRVMPEDSENAGENGVQSLKSLVEQLPYGITPEDTRNGRWASDSDPGSGALPQNVADRMLRRILGFGGVPLSMLFAFFGVYFVAKYKFDITVIPAVVAYSTLGCIAAAGVGITYGIMSSSWDEQEGSLLGWDEARKNVFRVSDGLMTKLDKERRDDKYARELKKINELRRREASNSSDSNDNPA